MRHSYDPHTERCIYCGIDRMVESDKPCKGTLRYREYLLLAPNGTNWLRRSIIENNQPVTGKRA